VLLEQTPQALPADVLHHDVAVGTVLGEVEDLDDVRVFDLGEKAAFCESRSKRVSIAGVEESLEDDPAVLEFLIAREIDPAEAAVREAADHLVLAADHVAGLQLRPEGEAVTALRAEALDASGYAVAAASDRFAVDRAEALGLGDRGVVEHCLRGVVLGDRRDVEQPRSETVAW
jgi:hypothetical protein